MTVDPFSQAGKFPTPSERFDVAVVGAGGAGVAAAMEAAAGGRRVLLVDENPVPPGLIGLDVPLRYGGRATAAVQRPDRMIEQLLAADPRLADAFDAGIDVRLGTCAWGAWARPGIGQVLGLADETSSSMVGFGTLVVACGARDLAIGFEGADLPGVMGANALHALLVRYNAFSGRRVAVVGSGRLAESTAALCHEHGLAVERVALPDVPLRAGGNAEGVTSLVVADADGRQREIACDTVCLAIGLVPCIELAAVLGAPLSYDAARGGWVAGDLPFLRVVGDAAGTGPDDRIEWFRAMLRTGGGEPLLCICEEVSRAGFADAAPPRYLGATADGQAVLDPGGRHPDHVKRLTRAGMGPCQGRRCREQIAIALALEADGDLSRVPLASYRMPLRPVPLGVLGQQEEDHETWPVWFAIDTQWTHWRDIAVQEA
jgi:hypothetical protein